MLLNGRHPTLSAQATGAGHCISVGQRLCPGYTRDSGSEYATSNPRAVLPRLGAWLQACTAGRPRTAHALLVSLCHCNVPMDLAAWRPACKSFSAQGFGKEHRVQAFRSRCSRHQRRSHFRRLPKAFAPLPPFIRQKSLSFDTSTHRHPTKWLVAAALVSPRA